MRRTHKQVPIYEMGPQACWERILPVHLLKNNLEPGAGQSQQIRAIYSGLLTANEVRGMSNNIDSPVHTITIGSVVVRIFRGCTQDGFTYLYFQAGRKTPRSAFAQRFYDRDEKDLLKATQEAATWIRKNPQAADELQEAA